MIVQKERKLYRIYEESKDIKVRGNDMRSFKVMAHFGITTGFFLLSHPPVGANPREAKFDLPISEIYPKEESLIALRGKEKKEEKSDYDANDSNIGYHLFTEEDLLTELNEEGLKTYQGLSSEGKKLALQVASMRCAKTNPCAGLNACATDSNNCAGQGTCKGTGKCGMSDKNLAVRLVSKKMSLKREALL